jgi:hypothetical protein
MKRNKLAPEKIDEEDCGAVLTHGSFSFVYINPVFKDQWDLIDTIVHESVHVFQEAMSYAQEEKIGIESQAYHIATISTKLLKDFHAVDERRKAGLQT